MREWVAILVDRDAACVEQAKAYLQALPAGVTVLSGGDRAVDAEIAAEAARLGLKVISYSAQRDALGVEAGVARNRDMVDDASRVVVFHTGKSWGLQTTIRYAQDQKKKVDVFRL